MLPDFKDVKGQEAAKRALEVAAAGGHHLLMVGPPGAGKSMLAQRLPSILPPMDAREMLEASMIASLAGELGEGRLVAGAGLPRAASFGKPAGSGRRRAQGQARRNGACPSWRAVSRRIAGIPAARARIAAPAARIGRDAGGARQLSRHLSRPLPDGRRDECLQMRQAANPASSAPRGRAVPPTIRRACRARCSTVWTSRSNCRRCAPPISPCRPPRKAAPRSRRGSLAARLRQRARFARLGPCRICAPMRKPMAAILEEIARPDEPGLRILREAADAMALSARGYHRVLRVARTLADLDGAATCRRGLHIAEALSYRQRAGLLRQAA